MRGWFRYVLPIEEELLVDLYEVACYNTYQIAELVGCGKTHVNTMLRRLGVTLRPKRTGSYAHLAFYPEHRGHFLLMHGRGGVHPRYEDSKEGFLNFVHDIGPFPEDMTAPTVGRYDHSKGYEPGNFRWQEKAENSRESAIRNASLLPLNRSGYNSHLRWHIKRGRLNSSCKFCAESVAILEEPSDNGS